MPPHSLTLTSLSFPSTSPELPITSLVFPCTSLGCPWNIQYSFSGLSPSPYIITRCFPPTSQPFTDFSGFPQNRCESRACTCSSCDSFTYRAASGRLKLAVFFHETNICYFMLFFKNLSLATIRPGAVFSSFINGCLLVNQTDSQRVIHSRELICHRILISHKNTQAGSH